MPKLCFDHKLISTKLYRRFKSKTPIFPRYYYTNILFSYGNKPMTFCNNVAFPDEICKLNYKIFWDGSTSLRWEEIN